MSDAITVDPPAGPPAASKVRVPATASGKEISGKLKRALDAMVWDGMPWLDAAKAANFDGSHMRRALERPHVIRYIREQKQVFRTHASARNIVRAVEIRDQTVNQTAAIQAIRYLDGLSEQEQRSEAGRGVTPGVVVQISVQTSGRNVDDTVIQVGPGALADGKAVDDEA